MTNTMKSPIQGNLFANDFLEDAIAGLPAWKAWNDESLATLEASIKQVLDDFPTDIEGTSPPNESVTEDDLIWPVLEALGWTASLRHQNMSRRGRADVPDGILFMDVDTKQRANHLAHESQRYDLASAIVESKRWDRPLDRGSSEHGETDTPSTQMLRYLRRADALTRGRLRWGVLTNGAIWRLYDYRARSVADHYFEFDIRDIWGHGTPLFKDTVSSEDSGRLLKLFATMFGHRSFLTDPASGQTFHQQALEESESYRARITDTLSKTIFQTAYPRLAQAIAEQCPKNSLPDIREAALVFLYRLLFLLYAEDRNLLPVHDRRYAEYAIRDKVRRDIGEGKDANRAFSTSAVRYWSVIRDLCICIDRGDESIGLPPYNGGLFDQSAYPILNQVALSDEVIADVIDALAFDRTAGRRRYINFRDLGVQHLGSVYEGLLEQELVHDGQTIVIHPNKFARKKSGSYYTPDALVSLIIEETVGPLIQERERVFEEAVGADAGPGELAELDAAERILNLRICDPAMGSGHFLVNLVDYLSDRVLAALAGAATIDGYDSPLVARIQSIRQTVLENAERNNWRLDVAQLDDRHIVRRMILKRCVFGVDKNPMAVELAKVALWLHTFTVGAPLSFLDHHLRCGNSLFGSWIHSADPFAERGAGNILLRGPLDEAIGAEPIIRSIEDLTDAEIDEAHESAARFIEARTLIKPLDALLSFFCALRWLHAQRKIGARKVAPLLDGTLGDLGEFASGKLDLPHDHELAPVLHEARALIDREQFFHWQTAFPGVWSDWGDSELRGGFDAIIGNPPWERIKLEQVQWFALRNPTIARAPRAADRKRMVAKLIASGSSLAGEFLDADDQATGTKLMARNCGDYPLLSKGDINLYALFVERAVQLLGPNGAVGLLVPSGIASDKTSARFFRAIATKGRLRKLYDFENRRSRYEGPPFFTDVDGRFKFSAFIATAKPSSRPAECAFFLHDVAETLDRERTFAMTAADFAKVNPNTGTAPLFRSRRSADLTKEIYDRLPVLVDRSVKPPVVQWPVTYDPMFHMASDSAQFHTQEELEDRFQAFPIAHGRFRDAKGTWFPLYEGKMVQAFDHRAADIVVRNRNLFRPGQPAPLGNLDKGNPERLAQPRYYVQILNHELEDWLEENRWNLAFKDVTATTNTRTMIASVIPAAAAGHTLPILRISTGTPNRARIAACMLANLNSLVFDFLSRQKVPATHFTWFVLEQIPVVPLGQYTEVRFGTKTAQDIICDIVLRLTYTSRDLAAFATDLGHVDSREETEPPCVWDPEVRLQLLCKLDAIFFHLYGITDPDDVRYIFSTFLKVRDDGSVNGVHPRLRACLVWINALTQGEPDAVVSQ